MLSRDEYISKISDYLDKIYQNHSDNSYMKHEAIMTKANHTMNMDISIDENNHHLIFWNNKKAGSNGFDHDLEELYNYICILEGENNNE